MPRLFVAVRPDQTVRRALAELPSSDEPGVRRVPSENWHVTLRFLGEVASTDVPTLIEALDAAPLEAAVLEFGPALVRLGRRQIVIPVDGAATLAAVVLGATSSIGVVDQRSFFGHLTVARTRESSASRLEGVPFRAHQRAGVVELVESELRPTGAVHSTVHRRRLG